MKVLLVISTINTIAIATFYLLLFIAQKNITKKNKGAQKICELQKKKK